MNNNTGGHGGAGSSADSARADFEINACGAQCPGPIMKLKEKLDAMQPGQVVKILSTDAGFACDMPAWCKSTGNELISITSRKGTHAALIRKGTECVCLTSPPLSVKDKAFVVFSGDLDRAMAAFIIANGAASMGNNVTLFFTFWGLNILRKKGASVKKDLMSSMFGMMMPKGAGELTLSKMNMGGLGTKMMKMVMKQKNVHTMEELVQAARKQGVRLVACSMTMEIMGIKQEELLAGVEIGGVADFLATADRGNMAMFI